MADLPIAVTVADVKNPSLLVRLLRGFAAALASLSNKVDGLSNAIRIPSMSQIREALQSSGSFPINVTGLRGVLSDSQLAAALRYDSAPTGLVLQNLKDAQLVLVTNGSGYDLYTVIKGNPNTLFKLISGAAGGNMMTTDTNQTPGTTVVKTWTAAQIFNGGLTAAGNISISAGQISSASQFYCYAFNSAVQSIPNNTLTAITFDSEDHDQGGVHSTSVNTSRLTVPTGGEGLWLFIAQITFAANAVGTRKVDIFGNSGVVLATTQVETNTDAGKSTAITCAVVRYSVATDYVEARAYQNSGGALNTSVTDNGTFLLGYKLP